MTSFGFAELHGGGTRVRVVPALGGKLASIFAAGREWLWTSDVIQPAEPVDGASYVETADTGGYDECFPTVAPCQLPSGVSRFGGLSLPDHGELWSQRAEIAIQTQADGQRATCTWTGRRMPYVFTRGIYVNAVGVVVLDYAVRNTGTEPLPYIWSAHPLFPLAPTTRLDLPPGARARVWARHGDALRGMATEFRWPHVRLEKRIVDMSVPEEVARRYACKLFIDLPPGTSNVGFQDGAARLDVSFDSHAVPNVGLWLNKRGWTPFRRGTPYLNFGLEPCVGAPDALTDALGSWHAAHWLAPGETREWKLTWRAA